MFHANHSLVLYADHCKTDIIHKELITFAAQQGLIGQQEEAYRFQVGEQFLSLLCFMGCSPAIELYPQANNQAYCYIEIPAFNGTSNKRALISDKVKVPRCQNCKAPQDQLVEKLRYSAIEKYTCSQCQNDLIPAQLNWRKTAIFSPYRIIIQNIYEAEALPDGNFLTKLEKTFPANWRYAYIYRA